MSRLRFGYSSYGTLSGTVRNYDPMGNDIGPFNLTGYGVFFIVRESWADDGQKLFSKSVGTGINITNATNGQFSVFFSSKDLSVEPAEYCYDCYISYQGTSFVPGTTELKSIGAGIFEVLKGVKYE